MFADQFFTNIFNPSDFRLQLQSVANPYLIYTGISIPDSLFNFVVGESLLLYNGDNSLSTYGIIQQLDTAQKLVTIWPQTFDKFTFAKRRTHFHFKG